MSGSLDRRLAALADAAGLARGRLDEELVDAAEAVVRRAGRRLGLGVEATVVALAGPTGAGKSTLFNALAGTELARASHRRPTTSAATAAIWGDVGDELLDWLEVPRRHGLAGDPAGLVLLDLPDFDSVERSHRVEVQRVVALADLMVWVVDPQKYADGVLHEHYLRPLARYRVWRNGPSCKVMFARSSSQSSATSMWSPAARRVSRSASAGNTPALTIDET